MAGNFQGMAGIRPCDILEPMLTDLRVNPLPTRVVARRLPALHASVYRALTLLMPDDLATDDCLVSRIKDTPELYLLVLERHAYTSFLRLTYVLGEDRRQNPNAHIRVYHDARMAEATGFSPGQGFERLAGPELPVRSIVERNWRLNRALMKWLDYLLAEGHGVETLKPLRETPEFVANPPPVDEDNRPPLVFDTPEALD